MNPLWKQLAHAYRQEEALYLQVLDLANRQEQAMEAEPCPAAVLGLCDKAEKLMAEIAVIEDALAGTKKQWEGLREDPEGELRQVLTAIECVIGQITAIQESVQRRLLEQMQRHRQAMDDARASINAGRASRLYDPERGNVA
jgi:hypothetical protein